MAAKLGLLSLNQLQKSAQFQQQKQQLQPPIATSNSWMWNPKQVISTHQDEDDSWEVRAFEQDSGNITWPPRSYTCTFCRREFRSAQALGGHMNVHRRDRARLHQPPPPPPLGMNNIIPATATVPSSALLIPPQEFVTNAGLCLLYSLPNPYNSCIDSPPTFLSVSPFQPNTLISPCPPQANYYTYPHSINSSICHSSTNTEPSASNSFNDNNILENSDGKKGSAIEELDLELRLGPR